MFVTGCISTIFILAQKSLPLDFLYGRRLIFN